MTIDVNNARHIIADEGKQFVRISSQEEYGKEIFLGYSYYINGILQEPPHYDVPEDFEEIDFIEENIENNIIDEGLEIPFEINIRNLKNHI